MNRQKLIKKWLDNELSPLELKAFKKFEDYDELTKLSNSVKHFRAPEYNVSEELNNVLQSLPTHSKPATNWMKQAMRIAAIIVLGFSLYYYTTTLDTNISTLVAEKTSVELPDDSQVSLNALSTLTYNKKKWSKTRNIALKGEAYFKVSKGSTFRVKTPTGIVTVLGTQFNVKQRNLLFEVDCYEGSVEVTYNKQTTVLKAGDSFLILDGKYIAQEKESKQNPSWINNKSYFKSIPLRYVINEFERQYNHTVDASYLDLDQLYTGTFSHKDIELALKSITLPLNLKYSIQDNSVVLTRE